MRHTILPYIPPALSRDFFNTKINIPAIANTMRVEFTLKFNKNCRYVMTGNSSIDNKDFNKCTGIKFNLFKSKKNSVMLGWRYNSSKDVIEVLPYWHRDKSKEFDELVIRDVDIEEEIQIAYTFDIKTGKCVVAISSRYIYFLDTKYFNPACIKGKAWFIHGWFGGTSLPDQRMDFDITKRVTFA